MNWYKLKHAAFHDYTTGDFGAYKTEVFVNPTKSEFSSINPARVIIDPNNGNVYAASDMESTHFDIRKTLKGFVSFGDFAGIEGFARIEGNNIIFDLRTKFAKRIIGLIKNHIPNAILKEDINELV